MTKGTLLNNIWIVGALSLLALFALIAVASMQGGGLAVEFAGLQLTLAQHENGGVMLSFLDLP